MAKETLEVQDLQISFGDKKVIHNSNFKIYPNEIVGVVGESGSGKSITSLAIMGLLPSSASQSGKIIYNQQEITSYTSEQWRTLRGAEISMIFQEPMSALNPSMKCGDQVAEIIQLHHKVSKPDAKKRVLALFQQVQLPRPTSIYDSYPHQISGGQQQRVVIAIAIACNPKVLVADEPTTALDVTVQKEIISLLKSLQQHYGMSIIFITHDLALIAEIADRVLVMQHGHIVEQADVHSLFSHPQHTYTQALLKAIPSKTQRLHRLYTVDNILNKKDDHKIISLEERQAKHQQLYTQAPLLEVRDLQKTYFSKAGILGSKTSVNAVDSVSFKIYPGETLGLVGESGCGKSTLAKAILQLDKATAGQILYKGTDITQVNKEQLKKLRKEIQIIFQDPFASLNPRLTVGQAIIEPMKVHKIWNSKAERKNKVLELLEQVGLSPEVYSRYPHEFSGGQRQRIGIARTIAVQPQLIICDESVSALDVSVQAQVLNLLNDLQDKYGFTYIFISHDLGVVKYFSDQLLVMNKGKIEEAGEADALYENPTTEYARKLIHAIPKGL